MAPVAQTMCGAYIGGAPAYITIYAATVATSGATPLRSGGHDVAWVSGGERGAEEVGLIRIRVLAGPAEQLEGRLVGRGAEW